MTKTFQPPPTYANLGIVDKTTGQVIFNPIWLNWFNLLQKSLVVKAQPPTAYAAVTAPTLTNASPYGFSSAGDLTALYALVNQIASTLNLEGL